MTLNEIQAEERALTDFQFAIIDAMNERGVSQSDLANMLGVSRARVSQLLSPEANPTLKLVGRALKALDMRAEYVWASRNRERKDGDFWELFIAKVEAHGASHRFTADQVSIFKSRATMRASLWDSNAANENHAERRLFVDVA
ncbi:helix-turn-helix transcriptional regulator [Mesorhizobium sp.]|uniref:helix-turn-helix transcriptional regulator n=1 Tax=Mesorhizobium sp. TaxID=1871066 RepID=UPI0025C234BA|nr:helix-turn-helix transcriptional regulator [Mesorhizobium sp.]